jgi:LmbE family N-acetylglucosaminyl deacetylase
MSVRRLRPLPSVIILSLVGLWCAGPGAQVRPTYSDGVAGLLQKLQALRTTASILYIAAHPDDEDSALIARLTRGDHARTAYLSLNRGEGGQNIIGPELFEALGVIRTEELLQARALDGGQQFFTRSFDYGFSKTLDEARAKWDAEAILGDVVRAIRLFRPLIVAARFSGTPADGHGQHQFAGYITPLAFEAAADPGRFPEHLAEGLRPWQAQKLYQGQSFRDTGVAYPLEVDTGRYDATLGRSYFEIAMQGRSQHKSQQMGALELRGRQTSRLRLIESHVEPTGATDESLFDGIDTSVPGLGRVTGLPRDVLQAELRAVEQASSRAMRDFDALAPSVVAPALAEGLAAVRVARRALAGAPVDDRVKFDTDFLLARKAEQFEAALVQATGLVVDALADRETVAPGETFGVAVNAFVPETSPVEVMSGRLEVQAAWSVESAPGLTVGPRERFAFFREVADRADTFRVTVPGDAPPTTPYWLRAPRTGDMFEWSAEQPQNEPFGAPVLVGVVDAEVAGVRFTVRRPVEFRFADRIRGELRRPVNVVPSVSVGVSPELDVIPLADTGVARPVAVKVVSHAMRPIEGVVRLDVPDGWRVEPGDAAFALPSRGEGTAVEFLVTPPRGAATGRHLLRAEAEVEGQRFSQTLRAIAYPHIQTHRMYGPATVAAQLVDLRVAPVSVGYIMGSGDAVPEAIRRMGLDVALLDADALAAGDLAAYDTIVVGIRASQTRPDFVANHGRLLDYVEAGGTLIVQYQQNDYVDRGLPPFPAEMSTRVTDEGAPVTVLEAFHPAFNFPNRIVPVDWDDWVQERNLYAFSSFDDRYLPLLRAADPGEPPQLGGQVYAAIGDGHYVYTSYSWFRELPAGVPGAYRLFANLLSLSRAEN